VGHYGSSGVVVFWGLGEISVGLFDIDAVTPAGAAFLPERHRVYPFPTPLCVPGETLGLVRAAAASSSFSFLKVLLGTRCFDVLGAWWEFSEGRSGGRRVIFVSLICRCRHLFLLSFFLFFFFWDRLCCGPSKLIVSGGGYINIAGRKPVLS
jgi:hypothetical protein